MQFDLIYIHLVKVQEYLVYTEHHYPVMEKAWELLRQKPWFLVKQQIDLSTRKSIYGQYSKTLKR